jgi:hypothetical protein
VKQDRQDLKVPLVPLVPPVQQDRQGLQGPQGDPGPQGPAGTPGLSDILPITLDTINNFVGINQTTPTQELDVTGNARVTGTLNPYQLSVDNTIVNVGNCNLGNSTLLITAPGPSVAENVLINSNCQVAFNLSVAGLLSSDNDCSLGNSILNVTAPLTVFPYLPGYVTIGGNETVQGSINATGTISCRWIHRR